MCNGNGKDISLVNCWFYILLVVSKYINLIYTQFSGAMFCSPSFWPCLSRRASWFFSSNICSGSDRPSMPSILGDVSAIINLLPQLYKG